MNATISRSLVDMLIYTHRVVCIGASVKLTSPVDTYYLPTLCGASGHVRRGSWLRWQGQQGGQSHTHGCPQRCALLTLGETCLSSELCHFTRIPACSLPTCLERPSSGSPVAVIWMIRQSSLEQKEMRRKKKATSVRGAGSLSVAQKTGTATR